MASGSKSRKLLRKAEVLGFPTEETANHWLIPVPIYTKRISQRHGRTHGGNFQTAAFQETYQVPWETLAVPTSRLPKPGLNSDHTQQGHHQNNGTTRIMKHTPYPKAYIAPYSRPPPRRTLSGRLARKGTKNSALLRAQSKNSNRKVPFKDAVSAMPVEERADSITVKLNQYIFGKENIILKDLEDIIQTLALQTEQTMMKACTYLLKQGFFFSIIKVSYTNGNLHRKLLRDLKLLLEIKETSAEPDQEWNWHSLDCELFIRQFQSLHIINHYRHVRRQLTSLEREGAAALVRIERDMLLKVVMDFLDQLGPDSTQTGPRTPLIDQASSIAQMRTMGTQTLLEESSNVQVVLQLQCNSAGSSRAPRPPMPGSMKATVEENDIDTQPPMPSTNETIQACPSTSNGSVDLISLEEQQKHISRSNSITSSNILSKEECPAEDPVPSPELPISQEISQQQEGPGCIPNKQYVEGTITQIDKSSQQNIFEETVDDQSKEKNAEVTKEQQSMAIVCFRPRNSAYSTDQLASKLEINGLDQSTSNQILEYSAAETCNSDTTIEAKKDNSETFHQEINICGVVFPCEEDKESETLGDCDKTDDLIIPPSIHTKPNSGAVLAENEVTNQSYGEAVYTCLLSDHMEELVQPVAPVMNVQQDIGSEDLACSVLLLIDQDMNSVTVELKALEQEGQESDKQGEETVEDSGSRDTVANHSSAGDLNLYEDIQYNGSTIEDDLRVDGVTVRITPSDHGVSVAITPQKSLDKPKLDKKLDPASSGIKKEPAHLSLQLVPHGEGVLLVLNQEYLCDTAVQPLSTTGAYQPNTIATEKVESKSQSEGISCGTYATGGEDTKDPPTDVRSTQDTQSSEPYLSETIACTDRCIHGQDCRPRESSQGDDHQIHLAVDASGYVSLVVENKSKTKCSKNDVNQMPPQALLRPEEHTNVRMLVDASDHVSIRLGNASEEQQSVNSESNLETPVEGFTIGAEDQHPLELTMAVENSGLVSVVIGYSDDQFQPLEAQVPAVNTQYDADQIPEPLQATIVVGEDSSTTLILKATHSPSVTEDSRSRNSPTPVANFQADSRVQELAEEAALLEAQINEETTLLKKEKEGLEEHVENLMKILEEQQVSRSRASTPEDLHLLQEHQRKLMEEIAADKQRLSVVASTLAACFNSPRLDDDPKSDQDRILPESNGEAFTDLTGPSLDSACQALGSSMGEAETVNNGNTSLVKPLINLTNEVTPPLTVINPEASSSKDSFPCEGTKPESRQQQGPPSPEVNENSTTSIDTQPMEKDTEVSVLTESDTVPEVSGKAMNDDQPQAVCEVTEKESACATSEGSTDAEGQQGRSQIAGENKGTFEKIEKSKIAATIVWDEQAQNCTLKVTTADLQDTSPTRPHQISSSTREKDENVKEHQISLQTDPPESNSFIPTNDATSFEERKSMELDDVGHSGTGNESDDTILPALQPSVAVPTHSPDEEIAESVTPVCASENSAIVPSVAPDIMDQGDVQASNTSKATDTNSNSAIVADCPETAEQTSCQVEEAQASANTVDGEVAAPQQDSTRKPEPLEPKSKELVSDDQGMGETLQAFQDHLAQTKKIADVLQSCQKPSSPDGHMDTKSSTPQSDALGVGQMINFSPEDAAKLASLTEELKKSPEFDEPPTEDEINKFAEYMGMDLIEDKEFLYIAEWALTAPLPAGWTVHLDSQGNEFYYNTVTKVSQYDHPMDGKYRELFQKSKAEKVAKQNDEADVGTPCGQE